MAVDSVDPADTTSQSPWRARLTSPWAASVVLAGFYLALWFSLRGKSATFDEPGHATAGYVYWKFDDYRIDPENGNLSKRWIALPFLFGRESFPPITADGWRDANSWQLADAWFNRLGNDTTAMLARGRAMSGLIAVALGAVVWLWSRRLFGSVGGMISLLLYVLSPTLLANGSLMTSDTPAALGFLLSLWCIWATLDRVSVVRVLGSIVAISGLFLAKMSAPLLLPMAFLLAVVRIMDGHPLPIGATGRLTGRLPQIAAIILLVLVEALGACALVWACYGFRFEAFSPAGPTPHRFNHPWQWVLQLPAPANLMPLLNPDSSQRRELEAQLVPRDGTEPEWSFRLLDELEKIRSRGVLTASQIAILDRELKQSPPEAIPRAINFAREHRLLPEAFLFGYAHAWRTSTRLTAFFNGEISDRGWRTFFPYTFAVKTPLSFLAILGIAAGSALSVWRRNAAESKESLGRIVWRGIYPVLPLVVLVVVYSAVAVSSNLNIGHRHLLPIYPPLFVLGGGTAYWFCRRARDSFPQGAGYFRAAVVVLVGVLAFEVAFRFPNYLAYFNGIVTPADAHRHLVDSSLDWGQELPAIARYLERHPKEPAHLAFFGVGSPSYYGIKAKHIGGFLGLDWKLLPPMKPLTGASADELVAFLQQHPQYDEQLVFRLDGSPTAAVLMTQRSSAHRLGAGLYVISASMLQPLYYGNVNGHWNATLEDSYQRLRQAVQPFLSENREAKLAAMPTRPVLEWMALFDDYYDFRLARLTTFLRTRVPDDTINFSVLVYRLTEADLARALDGPVP